MLHVITKWNQSEPFETHTIEAHCSILEKFSGSEQYVWWGKISKSGNLGLTDRECEKLNEQIKQTVSVKHATHLYLYAPENITPPSTLHVAKLEEVSNTKLALNDEHIPSYYANIPYPIAFWFRVTDIRRLGLRALTNLREATGEQFDPVSTGSHYPRIIYEETPQSFFNYTFTQNRKWFRRGGIGAMMPRCFKTGANFCASPNVGPESSRKVFVGMPFKPEFQNMYRAAIEPALSQLGLDHWKADEQFDTIDLMCKICGGIQESAIAIIDISDWNPNVLFELGLIYGLGKNAILIKQDSAKMTVDLSGMQYIPYSDYNKLMNDMIRNLGGLIQRNP